MRYLPKSDSDRAQMLREIGIGSVDELFAHLPAGVRLAGELKLPRAKSESEIVGWFEERARENGGYDALMLGAGAYRHYRPVIIDALISRGEFLTAYTPYQAEISQGTLQAIFEFQTMIAELTGMTFHDLTHPDELEGSSDAVVRMVTGETTRLKLRKRYLRKDGTVVWGDVSMAVARDPDGSPRLVLGQLIDVSAEVANFEAMQRAASDLRLLAENASDVVLRINEHGTIVWVSPSVRTVLGWEPDVLVGTPSLSIVVHEDHEKVNAGRDIWRAGGDAESSVIGYRTSWGETREMAGRVRPMRDPDGTYRGGIVGLRDVTEEQQMRRELAYRASHDALTGVYNRDDLMQRLSDKLALPVRPRRPLGVLFIDVDNLKLVNDNLGHDVGDRVLVSIALALGAAVRREDVVARLSGDEFVVLVDHVDDAASLRLIAEKVRTTVGALPAIDGVTVSVSIGAVVAARDEDPSEVLKRADRALYAAKHGGRNQVCIDAGQHGQ